ncbi:MAG TPA: methyltransferase domain-containing protein [Spirochaetota bacterium]|nr:methyltransferase domain-containing protein [Spirochaetota bacterium]
MRKKIFILTAAGGRYGSGHAIRSQKLKKLYKDNEAVLYYLKPGKLFFFKKRKLIKKIRESKSSLVIIDKRENPVSFLKQLRHYNIKTIVLDSNGSDQYYADYVVRTLPVLKTVTGSANLDSTVYLPPPPYLKQKKQHKRYLNVNVFFGGEDKKNITAYFLNHFLAVFLSFFRKKKIRINILTGYLNKRNYQSKAYDCVFFKKLSFHSSSAELFRNADLVITHFGLTLFEAIANKVPFLILNPGRYHNRLAALYFADRNLGKINHSLNTAVLNKAFKRPLFYYKKYQPGKKFRQLKTISRSLLAFRFTGNCFICCGSKVRTVFRKQNTNIKFCAGCGSYFIEKLPLKGFGPHSGMNYNATYFLNEYCQTYGRTYFEDKEKIYNLSLQRLAVITGYKKSGTLLDIGAAAGFFLDKAFSKGYRTYGVEISRYAAAKIKKQHKVFCRSFLNFRTRLNFDVITMWYVIEHIPDINRTVEHIDALLADNGILALATPAAGGISAKINRRNFLEQSPPDHYYIFSIKALKRLFKKRGYKHLQTVSTGIHFSRFKKEFPLLACVIPEKLYIFLIRLFKLGDTFTVYFKKCK